MALTKIITDTIDLSSDTTALKMPKGTTAQRPDVLTVDYLVVAGGGGGGWLGGGGGAGGYLTDSVSLSTSSAYSVIIGAGGSGGNSGSPGGGSGANSKFTSSIEATGGGSGGGHATTAPGVGGSGGGGPSSGSFYNGAAGTTGQGNSGGDNVGNYGTGYGAGGGGGAGSAGVNGTSTTGGNGGSGLRNNLDGNNYYYAAGGGGGVQLTNTAGTGGSSIGGDGASDGNAGSNASPANRGSGGGGGGYSSAGVFGDGGDGSDGIIIIRVPVNYTATFTSGVTANGVSSGGAISPNTATGYNVWVVTATTDALQTVTFSGTAPTIGTTRENTTTGKMEIYTGAKGWRALQQTGQDVGVVPSNNFNTVLYTGNSTVPYTGTGPQQDIDLGFTTDLTWVKVLGNGTVGGSGTVVYDVTRGNYQYININSGSYSSGSGLAANAGIGAITNGFSVLDTGIGGSLGGAFGVNGSPGSAYGNGQYVSWSWKAGGTPISNPDGTTTSTISLNSDAGFSIVKTASVGGLINVGHGLGAAPEFIMLKGITNVGFTMDWNIWHKSIGTDAYLSTSESGGTSAVQSRSGSFPTVNTTIFENNWTGTSSEYVAYCWKSIPGYSLIGSYTGTGSATDFPIIYTGFAPAWLMIKRTDSTGNWCIYDNKRDTTNPNNAVLAANSANAQSYYASGYEVNFYNNGFQIAVGPSVDINTAGGDYIFMCFAS